MPAGPVERDVFAYFFSEASPQQGLRLVTRYRISLATVMPISYRAQIRQVEGVREVMVTQWFGGVYKDARDPNNFFARFAVEPDKLLTIYPEYKVPAEQITAFRRERTACLVGQALADRLNFKVGDRITLMGDIFPINLELNVRGIYDAPRDNENLLFHYEYLIESLPPGRRNIRHSSR